MKENLASLPTREIDDLVAEKVMKWKRITWREHYKYYDQEDTEEWLDNLTNQWHDAEGKVAAPFDEQDDQCNAISWSPSECLEHAMEVVEKIESNAIYLNKIDGEWFCTFWLKNDVAFQASAPTLSIAICLAALECKGGV